MIIAINGLSGIDNIREVSRLGVQWIGLDFEGNRVRRIHQRPALSGIMPDTPQLKPTEMPQETTLMGIFHDEMPQNIITHIYNFHLDVVLLNGGENTVLIDNLRRTVIPDIRREVMFIKTIRVQRHEDIIRAQLFEGHADYLLYDMTDAPWTWLTENEVKIPFLISGGLTEKDARKMRDFHHPLHVGFCLGKEMESEVGHIDVERVRLLLNTLSYR